jgi:phospholipase C
MYALEILLALAALAEAAKPTPGSIENLKGRIKNVVILEMENRSFDNLLGGQTLAGIENPINTGPYCNPYNVSNPAAGQVCSAANDFDSITNDPDHAVYGNNMQFYGTFNPDNDAIASGALKPSMKGFVQEQLRLYSSKVNQSVLAEQVLNYYTEEQVPVLTALVKNFVTFNHWHSAVPGVSTQNHTSSTNPANDYSRLTPTELPLWPALHSATAATMPPSRPGASTRPASSSP